VLHQLFRKSQYDTHILPMNSAIVKYRRCFMACEIPSQTLEEIVASEVIILVMPHIPRGRSRMEKGKGI
jgi:hypothetical protein